MIQKEVLDVSRFIIQRVSSCRVSDCRVSSCRVSNSPVSDCPSLGYQTGAAADSCPGGSSGGGAHACVCCVGGFPDYVFSTS